MIAANQLKAVFQLRDFNSELNELSSYAANIKQERPICYLLCKYLRRRGYDAILEKNKHDFVVNGASIELKFHYDFDIVERLGKEVELFQGDINKLRKKAASGKKRTGWPVAPGILRDVVDKQPDIFVWIISSRDLSALPENIIKNRVCVGTQQLRYIEKHRRRASDFLQVADDFLDRVKQLRRFAMKKFTLKTNRDFPNDYHVYICEFEK